jgi:hypothetical protein
MGAHVKQVQLMLGHSSAVVTLDTYSHVFPSLADQLREGLDDTYNRAKTRRRVAQMWPEDRQQVISLPSGEAKTGL